ncbi:ComEA family DNA-binding protein [Arthrobacter methylotrophus]|uniref:ComEA family DNA-binding protein n=1 Tax=Arthrobacter methylotrophus TaxID=121291 RepID=A0ABV5UUU0_9MICC
MPRRKGSPSANHAASAARQRFAARLAPEGPDSAGPGGAHRGHDNDPLPLLPLGESIQGGPGSSQTGFVCDEWEGPGESGASPRLRWRTPWRVATLLAIPCLLLLSWCAWQVWARQPTAEPLVRSSSAGGRAVAGVDGAAVDGAGRDGAGRDGAQTGSPDPHGRITVHVAGAVKNPGVVTLPVGARVVDAIGAAGGADPAAELNRLNLAAVVQDAAKIHVPLPGEPASSADGPAPGAAVNEATESRNPGTGSSAARKINLNTATAEELDSLPKVGPVLAKRIVEWRQQHGPFAAVEDLDAVDGVGPKMLETLLPLVTV